MLQRTKDLDNKETYLDAIKTTKMTTILGPIDFTSPIDPDPTAGDQLPPDPNVYKPVYTGGQRIKGTKWLTDADRHEQPVRAHGQDGAGCAVRVFVAQTLSIGRSPHGTSPVSGVRSRPGT